MKRLQSFLTLLVLLLVSVSASWAATLNVGPGKTYATIQAAVTAASGGDIIEVYTAGAPGYYSENVNIPGGKNGLIIREAAGQNAILDGTSVGNPKVAFRVASDNVTINGFTIQNYFYSGATNVAYGQAQRGIGIEAINASSQHTFTNNDITNCNFGIYVREGNNVTVENNTISAFRSTTFVGTWNQKGGIGIAFLSGGIAMDGNVIKNNLLDNIIPSGTYNGTYGIVYGRIRTAATDNVGADFVQIKNNTVRDGQNTDFFAYGILNIKGGESIDFSNNTSNACYSALDIQSSTTVVPSPDNEDVTFTNNNFNYTVSTVEVRAEDEYSGEKMWELMITNGNTFTYSADLSSAIASLEYAADIVTSDGTHRFILNDLDAGITEAEQYMNLGATDDGRVYITNGTYTASATATVNGLPATKNLKIQGQSLAAIIKSSASTILDIQSALVEVDPITFSADLNATPITCINTTGDETQIHHVAFTSNSGGPGSYYIGVKVNDAADNVDINNNTFDGMFQYGIQIESDNTGLANIECNTFNQTVSLSNAVGVYINDFNAGGDITNIEIYNNTFQGFLGYSIDINLPTVASNNIVIGKLAKGNIFNHNFTAIRLTQLAADQVSINYNKFTSSFTTLINNTAAFNVDAGFNNFGVSAPYPANIIAKLSGTNISWLPIYTSDVDQSTDCGFQPLLTSLWTPVYTATDFTGANSEITAPGNEYFLTVEAALADANTTTGDLDNVFLYLTGTYAETNAAVLDFNSAGISIAAAPAQPANLNTRPSPAISSTYAGEILSVNFNSILIDKIEFISGTNAAYYPINVLAAVTSDFTVTNCKFNVSGASNPDAAIIFANAANLANVTINNNTFTIGNGNYGIDFGTGAFWNSNVEVDGNDFLCADNITTSIRFNNLDDLDVTDNNFEAGIAFTGNAGTTALLNINIFGNTFLPTASSVPVAISFAPGAGTMNFVNIQQNKIHQFGIGIDINAAASANVNGFTNWTINENYFADMNDGINLNGLVPTGKLNATNNEWQSNYGPDAYANAPVWHDDAGNPIIANSYGKLYNDASGVNVVPLQNATYIQFVPWWNNISGAPATYTGTSFAPIENNEAPVEYFASLNFAIDETATTFDIYMQDVPDWVNLGQTVYYVESNTIENASKDLDIWGQPFWPPTTKIATTGNDTPDNMFLIAGGTFNVSFLELTYDQSSGEDIAAGMNYGLNGLGTIDWCYVNNLRSNAALAFGVVLSDATSVVNLTNSIIQNLDGPFQIIGIGAYDGSTLAVDNTVFNGRNNLGTASAYEMGIYIGENSNATVTNSYLTKYKGNAGIGAAIFANNFSASPVGNINIYQNIIEGNEYGLFIGENLTNDNYSSANIYNNIIRINDFGLRYEPNVASTLVVENNSWGSNNGPRSEVQAGGTQENTYNETAQGNAVVDGNANSTIDFHPWRRIVTGDDLATMISGPKFAPIVRTNAANIAQGLYSSFNDAEADLIPNQKIYAYAGTYSEHIAIDVSNVQFIGKLAPATYSAGWIIAPNAPQFVNAWTNLTQGANVAAPTIISGGLAQPLLVDDVAMFSNVSFKGFIFDTRAKVASPTVPYTGDPTEAINFNLNTNDITFTNLTFLADGTDRAISFGNGQHDNWDITYNKFNGVSGCYFAYINAQTSTTNINISYNDLDGGAIHVDKQGAATITNFDIAYNEFKNTAGAITLDGTAGGALQVITNFNVNNNVFEATNTYAFLVDQTADNAIVAASDWTTEIEVTNNNILIAPSAQIVVGFANATPLVTYSNEITATCNWWGSVFGPTFALNPGGNGARASEGVFFAPWLNGNSETTPVFGFVPAPAVTCTVGERVWVNSTVTSDPTVKTIVFPSLQWAVQHATVVNGTNFNIFVSDDYNMANNDAGTDWVEENITIDWNGAVSNALFTETAANELKINGNFELAGAGNVYNMYLGSPLRITGDLTLDNIGCQGWIFIDDNNLTVEGYITEGYYNSIAVSCQVATNGTGYLVKENVVTGGVNNFPVIRNSSSLGGTPANFVVNASGWTLAQNNKIKVRIPFANPLGNPVDAKGMGEDGYDVNNMWEIDFENNNGGNPDMAMVLRYLNPLFEDAPGYNAVTSYGAYWDMAPVATQWTTKKSTSSWNGSDGIQVTNLNLESGRTDWAIFSGSTSFALSDAPSQAKNIQWIGGDDRNLQFQWQRNGTNNQYYAIMAVKGSMTAVPSPVFTPQATGATVNSPWVASATSRNFSDGYVDNVTTPSWTAGLFHNLAATPTDVKVLKVGKYTGGLTENVTVTDLDQGTYYTFFVANFNYGDGSTLVPAMATGADGMANYNLNPNTLNPRTRKTQPAVYMTLDVASVPSSDVIVYGTTLPSLTDVTDLFTLTNHWRRNGTLTGLVPVNNQYNGDDLIGGNYAQFCEPVTTPFTTALYFKGYGNNGGSNWGIKYSENNSTFTFTTPLVNSTTNRTISGETKYYLVSAYDGDGKVAALYDNFQDLQIIFDQPAAAAAAFTTTMPSCAGTSATVLGSSTSTSPAATFDGWYISDVNGANWTLVAGATESYTFTLNYADNGRFLKAKYISNSVCSWNGSSFDREFYTNTVKIEVYDNTLTGSTPANVEACDNTPSVQFVSNEGTLVSPNDLDLIDWQYYDGVNPWGTVTGNPDFSVNTVGSPSVSTLTVSNLPGKDNYQFRAVWNNGNCAADVATAAATLRVVPQPSALNITTPATICANDDLTITASASNWTSVKWYIVGNATDLQTLAPAYLGGVNTTVGVNSVLSLVNLPVSMDGAQFYAVFTNSVTGVTQTCTNTTANSTIDVLPAPVLDAVADQTLCEATQLQVTTSGTSLVGDVKFYIGSILGTELTNGLNINGTTIALSGSPVRTLTIPSTSLAWNGVTIVAYNTNGTCDDEETFVINVDAAPTVGTATVTAGEVCEGSAVQYTVTYTPASTGTVVWNYNGSPVVHGNSVTGNTFNIASVVTAAGTSTLTLSNVSAQIDGKLVYAIVDNGTCNVVNSNSVSADIETIPVAPATVGAQNIFSHRFDITWTAVSNADSYDVQVSALADFSTFEANVNIAAPAVTWTGMPNCELDPAKTYYFRVRAKNQCGNGPWLTSNMVTLDPTVTNIAYTIGDGIFGNQQTGTSSAADTYTITYYQLDAGLQVVVPAEYEIKPTGSLNWLNGTVDLTPYLTLYLGTPGSPLTLNVQVRYSPTLCGLATGNLTHTTLETCAGVTDMPAVNYVSVSGTGVVAAPTVAATNGIVMENTANTFTSTWTNGNGSNRLVLISTNPTLSTPPSPNTPYTVGNTIGNGTVVAVLSNPTANATFTVPGAGNYYVHVWEYNACGANTEIYAASYYTFQPYYMQFATVIPNQTSGVLSGNVTINFTQRDGTQINNTVLGTFNVNIAQSPLLMTSSFTTTPNPVQILSGANSTTFKFTWTENCGVDNGKLVATATNVNGPTESNTFDVEISAPTQQARILVWVGTPCAASTTIKWTNGTNNKGRILVTREGALPISPVDGQAYTPNNDWSTRSAANNLGDNSYVMAEVFDANNEATIVNLVNGETYYFRVYEFNGCDLSMRKYITTNATFNPRSRTINCKEGNDLGNIVLDRFNAISNNGLAKLNFNTLYEANISGFELRRINLTDEEMNGMLIGSYMSNSELVAAGNTLTGKAYSFTDNSSLLEVGKTYLYQLTAIAFDGTRIDVAETELTINDDIYTGISQFSVSPVVVTNTEARFDLTVDKAQNVTITMYDVTGQKVASIANDTKVNRGTQQFTTNIQNVTNGTYMIVVEAADGVSAVQKFQIVR